MEFTILGSSGFIGSNLLTHLEHSGHSCFAPDRNHHGVFTEQLGNVIYCVGLTADFRQRPYDTVRAHVCLLADILEKSRFESLLYLSSTRVYAGALNGGEETPLLAGDIYNASKLTGEALCFASGRSNVRVARLSNVFGGDFDSDNFLPALIRAAVQDDHIKLSTALDSAKDYVSIDDVVTILPKIAMDGNQRIYNVASGSNTSNRELVQVIRELTGCSFEVAIGGSTISFPPIEIARLRDELGFSPAGILDHLGELVSGFRRKEYKLKGSV